MLQLLAPILRSILPFRKGGKVAPKKKKAAPKKVGRPPRVGRKKKN